MKEPELQDFDITHGQYALYKGTEDKEAIASQWGCLTHIAIALVVALVAGLVTRDSYMALGVGIVLFMVGGPIIFPLLTFLVMPRLVHSQRSRARARLLKSEVGSKINSYEVAKSTFRRNEAEKAAEVQRALQQAKEAEIIRRRREEAEEAQQRRNYDHWMSLSGIEFERQLGILYRQRGYRVESTTTSGDEGIDLILRKNGKTTVVQCKSHQKPVGPAIARELFGSMVAFRADDAILACTGGFTRGVKEFVRGKPITLISASELARMGSSVDDVDQNHEEIQLRLGSKE